MQRKMKLIRKILEYVEVSTTEERLPVPEFRDYSEAEVHYHLGLCEEAKYLVLYQPETDDPIRRFGGISRLTWAGHETLEAMRAGNDSY
ncbi:MAG: DUF2513 domain-containing protein [Chloroflexota bacterium]|nr:DUF2513 domain-containing protein [Chloroflexota bacterium]MDE2958609.1 DUF2513 domain-containing protein [Chloroflexota bacterium]